MPVTLHRAIVLDAQDPEQRGRLRLEIPTLSGPGAPYPAWVPPLLGRAGVVWIPPPQTAVSVAVDASGARWIGIQDAGALPAQVRAEYPDAAGLVDPSGVASVVAAPQAGVVAEVRAAPDADATARLQLADAVARLQGSLIYLQAPDAGAPPLHPYLLTTAFLADLAAVLTEIAAGLALVPAPAPLTTQMAADIGASLSAGAPYLSTRIRGD